MVVVDICNTLYDSNTTFDFIRYCVRTRRFAGSGRLKYISLLHPMSPGFWGIGLVQKFSKTDWHKQIAAGLLKDYSVKEVDEWVEDFYETYLKDRVIKDTFRLLEQFEKGNILLASSTLAPIAIHIAGKLGIDSVISTELEILNGRYTGRISTELNGRKLEAIQLKGMENIEVMVTDNFSDRPLMELADQRFAICYNSKHENFWSSLPGVHIIRLDKSAGSL